MGEEMSFVWPTHLYVCETTEVSGIFFEKMQSGELLSVYFANAVEEEWVDLRSHEHSKLHMREYYSIFAKVITRVCVRIVHTSATNQQKRVDEWYFVGGDAIGIDEKEQNLFSLWRCLLLLLAFHIQRVPPLADSKLVFLATHHCTQRNSY